MKKLLLVLLFVSGIAHGGSYALYDFSAHEYIVENNRQEVRPIASITKLFTAITVLNSGVDLDEKIKVNGRSKGYVPTSAFMTRMDLMRAMLISSDNKAAETLANHHPGGFDNFIREVNLYADSKGLYDTKIVDSTGLLLGNQSTAADLINFLSSIKHNIIIRSIAGERNAALNAPRGKKTIAINLHNTNPEIFVFDNILISKTGFTNPAGRCVLMLIEKKKELYGVIVLGQPNVKNRSILVKELLNIEVEPIPKPIINSTVDFEYSNPL
jgi:D-alanyl-D-alanine endopeptidase (penicillin-binding protein 7)